MFYMLKEFTENAVYSTSKQMLYFMSLGAFKPKNFHSNESSPGASLNFF